MSIHVECRVALGGDALLSELMRLDIDYVPMALRLIIPDQPLIGVDWEVSEVINHGWVDRVVVCSNLILQLLNDLRTPLTELIEFAETSCLLC